MKNSRHILFAALLLALLPACTHNNGDIGLWFGTWHLEQATADGQPLNLTATIGAEETADQWYFQFQSTVVSLRLADDVLHNEAAAYGRWSQPDDYSLTLEFPDPSVNYITLKGIETTNHLTIEVLTDKRMVLSHTASDGVLYRYSLKKLF